MNRSIWLAVLLVFSIGLNLLFVGIMIGRHAFDMPPERAHFQWMMQDISNETRKRLRSSMRQHMEATHEQRRELRKVQHSLLEAVTVGSYNEESVIAGFEELRRVSVKLQDSMHRQMVQNLRELTPEERSHAIRMLMHGAHGPRPPRHDR